MTTTPPIINHVYKTISFAAFARHSRWPALAASLVFACWAALLLPAAVSAAPLEPTPEPNAPAPSETQTVTPTESSTGAQPQSDVEAAAILPNVVAATAGLSHTCALNATGGILCWGDNTYGQVGTGTRTLGVSNPYPRSVSGLAGGAKAVAAGDTHTCALTTDGWVMCWGSNAYGQLGDGTTVSQLAPVTVTGLISGVQQIAAGGSHTCALTAAGGVKCWGDLVTTPTDVPGLTNGVSAIAAGYMHTCAIVGGGAAGGAVQCWGANDTGQLGNGTTTSSSMPVAVQGLDSGVKAISAGGAPVDRFTAGGHSCAVTTAGAVKCWGWNDEGQLGDGTTINRPVPVNVTGIISGAQDVAAGDKHTCALIGDVAAGTAGVKCWGQNRYGQLGVGTTESYPTPVQVGGFTGGVLAVTAGGAHTCAVTEEGGAKCWGRNAGGQLGNFTVGSQSLLPVNVIVPIGLSYLPQLWRQAVPVTQ
jgi:alpha-tubulin suppressor-like RCC1 family protein